MEGKMAEMQSPPVNQKRQRLRAQLDISKPSKAVLAYAKAEEILLCCETEIARPKLLSLVQIHHAQESMQSDIRQAVVWNTLSLILLKTGCLQSSISVLSSLLAMDPNNFDCLANLGWLTFKGPGANAGESACADQLAAFDVAKECLLGALKVDPKAAHTWVNLANAYHVTGDYRSSGKCLEKVLMAH
ncbi:hypothetical protein Dsin_032997 [Dipteronia sinensis]|uniref:Tetratricopeptide repeat protein n=1 Tax=Dipteronia sinensis TaxID=43782 RepID=A0AAE0DLC4_9ROSI|nr:hypothetical protein Dsin_033179 [Dipteronia sinensis]KAK3179337.1 hypothetical protein Dsin_032997 [Dipteronia sinensis]